MDIQINRTVTRSFTFDSGEAEALRAALLEGVNWQTYKNGEFEGFFADFYDELTPVAFGEKE